MKYEVTLEKVYRTTVTVVSDDVIGDVLKSVDSMLQHNQLDPEPHWNLVDKYAKDIDTLEEP